MFAKTFVSVILLLASVNSTVAAPIFGRQVDFASDRHGLMKKSTPKVDFTVQAPVNKRQDASSGQGAGSQDAFANLGGVPVAESLMEQIMSNLPSTLVPSASQLFADITATITSAPSITGALGSTENSADPATDNSSVQPTGGPDAGSTDSAAAAVSATSSSDGSTGSVPTGTSSEQPAGATAPASPSANDGATCGVPSSDPSSVSAPTDSPAGVSATASASATASTGSSDSSGSSSVTGTAAGTDATSPAGPTDTSGSSSADASVSTGTPNDGAASSNAPSDGGPDLPMQTSSADVSSSPTATGSEASVATATGTDASSTTATDLSASTATAAGAGNDALGQDLQKANQDVNNVIASLMSMLPESAQAQASEMVAAATQAISSDFSQISQAAQSASGSSASPTPSGMVTIAARHTSPTMATFLPRTNGAFSTHLTMSKTTLTGFVALLGSVLVGSLTV